MKPNLHRCRLGKRIATTRTVGASVPARPPEWRRSAVDVRYVVLNDQVWLAQTNKVYADGKGPRYGYTPDGRLSQRIWARGIVTDYSYDGWGSLTNTVYSDGTSTVTLLYDAMGRQTNAVEFATFFEHREKDMFPADWAKKLDGGIWEGCSEAYLLRRPEKGAEKCPRNP